MTAADARALCRDLVCIDVDPQRDRRALDALGLWLTRFTPDVSRGWDECSDPSPAALFLDLTGCERYFDGLERLVGLVKRSMDQFGIPTRMAVAPTVGASWALAVTNDRVARIVGAQSLVASLKPLPIAVLRLDGEVLGDLRHLGLAHVGEVLALPREQLPARFGPSLIKRLDQLTGARPEPLTKLAYERPITNQIEFDAPIEDPEDIQRIFEKLLDQAIFELTRRHRRVRRLHMILEPDRGWGRATVRRAIVLSRPHRDRAVLVNLLWCDVERIDCEHGFVRFHLNVPSHEPMNDAQSQLFEWQKAEDELELQRLFERLSARLGAEAVIQPQLVESYLPERAWQPAMDKAPGPVSATVLPRPSRPLTLFPMPIEIRVVCEPSDDRTGQPHQFAWNGQVHRVAHAVGPERIANEWWRGHRHTRDYYDVEDEVGCRFWLFRVIHVGSEETLVARWFLHGRFE